MFTLASDFGSPYPAAMKGVLLSNADGDPRLVDVAHDLPRQDPRAAAFWLRFVLPEFPPAVHLAVVDPGVGTDRAALVVVAGDHALVGPDNGSLLPPARALLGDEAGEGDDETGEVAAAAVDAEPTVFAVDAGNPRSSTFHGRDVFAPVAAAVHDAGAGNLDDLDRLEPTDDYVDLGLPEADVGDGRATGEVLVVDDFGNAVTNVPGAFLDGRAGADLRVETPEGAVTAPVAETFAAVDPGEPLVTVGSHGYVECDVNRGRGEAAFGVGPGDELVLTVV